MKQSSFSNLLWESAVTSWGGALTFLSFALALLVIFFAPDESVKLKYIIPLIIITAFLLMVAMRAAWSASKAVEAQAPRVMYAKPPPRAYEASCALLLVEPTPLLSHDAIVSVYYLEDDLERLVGVGKVINVQNDKKVQIVITDNYDFGEKLGNILNNSKDELNKLIIKASVPSFILEAITNDR